MSDVAITPRKLTLKLDRDIPRYWCNDSAFMTHMLNTYTLLIPDNEIYYIRHLGRLSRTLDDAGLCARLIGFCQQEAQHGVEHKAFWDNLDYQKINYRGFVKFVGWFNYSLLEPLMPRTLHLANIACIEHINAYIGNHFLQRNLLQHSDYRMKLLFYWHFAEEIEHKNVAFDVFQHISGSYFIRLISALLVFPLFYLINTAGICYLLGQDRQLLRWRTWKDMAGFIFKDGALMHALRNMAAYCKPGFNPRQVDDYDLARDFFTLKENQVRLRKISAT